MSLNLPDYAGNMGHKDQVLALKWIDKNIKHFGGGGNTTIFGFDSGIFNHKMPHFSGFLFIFGSVE